MEQIDNLIAESDDVFAYLRLRNVGFIEILYDADELLKMAVDTYNDKRLNRPLSHCVNEYTHTTYPGDSEDKESLMELLDQAAIRIEQNVNSAHKQYGRGRPITNVIFHDSMLLVALG